MKIYLYNYFAISDHVTMFAEATGAISQGCAFCKYVVQPL